MVFWCYCIERRASVINATIRVNHLLEKQLLHSRLTVQLIDISSICEFGWYNRVMYRAEGHKFTLQHQNLGRALGPSNNDVSAMSQWVITGTGDIMPIQMLRQLTPYERSIPVMIKRMKGFDDNTKKKYGYSMNISTYKSLSINMYPEHDNEPSNADSGEVGDIHVP